MLIASPFCATPTCLLHVCEGDAGVTGSGQWATIRALGITVSRTVVDGVLLCDVCARDRIEGLSPIGIGGSEPTRCQNVVRGIAVTAKR